MTRGTMWVERPVLFASGAEQLFGIVTEPLGQRQNVGVVLPPGGAGQLSLNRNAWNVRLARSLSVAGYPSIRFDYRGIGESTGVPNRFELRTLLVEDLEGALRTLRATTSVRRVAIVGSCYGARLGLEVGARDADVAGLYLVTPPIVDSRVAGRIAGSRGRTLHVSKRAASFLRPSRLRHLSSRNVRGRLARLVRREIQVILRRARKRVVRSKEPKLWTEGVALNRFLRALEEVQRRRIPTVCLYGDADDYLAVVRERMGDLMPVFGAEDSSARLSIWEGKLHGLQTLDAQDRVLDAVMGWVEVEFGSLQEPVAAGEQAGASRGSER